MINQTLLILTVQQGETQLAPLTGSKKLALLFELVRTANLYSPRTAEKFLDDHIDEIETSDTEEAALLMGEKALLSYQNSVISDAEEYAEKALALARAIGSNQAQAIALLVKGFLNQESKQHTKAAALFTLALEKASTLQRSSILLELGSSFNRQGDYERALNKIMEALRHSEQLIHDESFSEVERMHQIKTNADIWSRLGVLYESVGDLPGAKTAYDKSLELSDKYELIWEKYKTLSRMVKFFTIQNNWPEAERSLIEAQNLPLEDYSPKALLYIVHDWARIYRASGRYSDALDKYSELLFGQTADKDEMEAHFNKLMNEFADLFGEIIVGVQDCLVNTGKQRDAEMLGEAFRTYDETVMDAGIYKEIDKGIRLKAQQSNIMGILETIFKKRPLTVRYKHLLAEYDPDKEKADVTIDGQSLVITKRAFFILKFLDDNRGECVTKQAIEEFWRSHGEAHQSEKEEEAGVREYIRRLRNKLGLKHFIETCPKPKGGWRLVKH